MSTTSIPDTTPAADTAPVPLAQGGRALATIAGLAAVAVALGVGELVAGTAAVMASPVQAVAEAAIDLAPGPIERWAVSVLGTADKPALVGGVLAACLLLGAVVGVLGRRRPLPWSAAFVAVGALGAAASLRGGAEPLAAVPSAVAAVVGAVAHVLLQRRAAAATATAGTPEAEVPATSAVALPRRGAGDRRRFLALAGVLGAGAAAAAVGGRALAATGRAAAQRAREAVLLPRPAQPAGPLPAGAQVEVAGMTPFVTPMEDFYRVDTALVVPRVDISTWRLELRGMVGRPLTLTYDELLARPHVERDITLTCVSNEVGGRLAGHARWQGVLLRDLLDEAGVDPAADQVVGRSVDGYTCGFPVAAAYDREALLVIGMNGEPLPVDRGFPARLIVPGLYGYVSATKWLREIELTTFAAFDQYWVNREWDAQAPIKTMSRIDVPRPGAVVDAGTIDVAGVAWAQTRGIERVEVRIDQTPWVDADLGTTAGDDSWRQWHLRWDALTPGPHRITVRATDGDGVVQAEERAAPFPNGASGWMTSLVTVRPQQS